MNRQFPGRDFHPLATCAFVAHQDIVVLFGAMGLQIIVNNLSPKPG
jgi:hypothetical protein